MKKTEARKLYAHFEAAGRLTWVMPFAIFLTALAIGYKSADAMAIGAAALAFAATMAAVSVDVISKRIPNSLSLAALLSAPLWWLALFLGSDIPAHLADGMVMNLMGKLYGMELSGAVLPLWPQVSYPLRIPLDIVMMAVVFVPLYFSFALGLGFGGGDVKLMTATSLFLGWPLGLDFFFLTFLIGGVFSVAVLLGRKSSLFAIRMGANGPMTKKLSTVREFPFAPAIGLAAIVCFATKLEGLF